MIKSWDRKNDGNRWKGGTREEVKREGGKEGKRRRRRRDHSMQMAKLFLNHNGFHCSEIKNVGL